MSHRETNAASSPLHIFTKHMAFTHGSHDSTAIQPVANTTLAQSSDFHWPAELRGVRPRNLEQFTSLATRPRTVAEHLQAPAEDLAFPARVNHRPAPLWLNSEFGTAYKNIWTQLNSTQPGLRSTVTKQLSIFAFTQQSLQLKLSQRHRASLLWARQNSTVFKCAQNWVSVSDGSQSVGGNEFHTRSDQKQWSFTC